MVKLTRVFSVISLALVAYCFLGFFILLLFQDSMISMYAGREFADAPFLFPVSIFIKVTSLALSGVLIFIVAGKTKTGYWGEITVASVISFGTIALEWFVSMYQNIRMGSMGSETLTAYSALVSGFSIHSLVVSFAVAVILFTCGLSIATKVYERRLARESFG